MNIQLQELIKELEDRMKSHSATEYQAYMADDLLQQGISLGKSSECDFIIVKLTKILNEAAVKNFV